MIAKDDNSPVTEADREADKLIVARLKALAPEITCVSEEGEKTPPPHAEDYFWLVDPLDGTKSFIKRTGEFTVNIGLIHARKPVLGVVYAPARETLYFTGEDGKAYRLRQGINRRINVRTPPPDGLSVIASASHLNETTQQYINALNVKDYVNASSSLKFCLLAEGKADIYPRFGPTMEWDTAAAHAVLNAAGGSVLTEEDAPFLYHKTEQELPWLNGFFIARGSQ